MFTVFRSSYFIPFCRLQLSPPVVPFGWGRQRRTRSCPFVPPSARLRLHKCRDMICLTADIANLLPVCVSSCRGFILLAQSNAPLRSPGRTRRPRRLRWCGLTVFCSQVRSGAAHDGAIPAGALCVKSTLPMPTAKHSLRSARGWYGLFHS